MLMCTANRCKDIVSAFQHSNIKSYSKLDGLGNSPKLPVGYCRFVSTAILERPMVSLVHIFSVVFKPVEGCGVAAQLAKRSGIHRINAADKTARRLSA
jgi:hypothetical protein